MLLFEDGNGNLDEGCVRVEDGFMGIPFLGILLVTLELLRTLLDPVGGKIEGPPVVEWETGLKTDFVGETMVLKSIRVASGARSD